MSTTPAVGPNIYRSPNFRSIDRRLLDRLASAVRLEVERVRDKPRAKAPTLAQAPKATLDPTPLEGGRVGLEVRILSAKALRILEAAPKHPPNRTASQDCRPDPPGTTPGPF